MHAQHSPESGFYVDLAKTDDGNLHIRLNRNGRRHFADIRRQRDAFGVHAALFALLEDHLCSGWEIVPPEDIGALTAAPILSDEIVRDDEAAHCGRTGVLVAAALQEGWTRLQRDDGPGWNYLGVCPQCQAKDEPDTESELADPQEQKRLFG